MRILIFGASASGTTTLGQSVANRLGIVHLDTDDYFWKKTDIPYTQKLSTDERISLIKADILRANNVIISGSLSDWGLPLTPLLTGAVRLSLEHDERIKRLIKRERDKYGDRILPNGDMYQVHKDFVRWTEQYDTSTRLDIRTKAQHDWWQSQLNCPVLMLDSTDSVQHNTEEVIRWIKDNCLLSQPNNAD